MAITKFNASRTPLQRFWEKVDRSGDCWLWTGACVRAKNGDERGQFYFQGKTILAPRFMWLHIMERELPSGHGVLHTCDNGRCVRPIHLFSGTQKDNMVDCASKGRCFFQQQPERRPIGTSLPICCGEAHPNVKLDWSQVQGIHSLRAMGWTFKRIGEHYGVSDRTASNVVRGRYWRVKSAIIQRVEAVRALSEPETADLPREGGEAE